MKTASGLLKLLYPHLALPPSPGRRGGQG